MPTLAMNLLTSFSTPFFTSLMPIYITKMSKVQVYALPLDRYSSQIPPLKEDSIMNVAEREREREREREVTLMTDTDRNANFLKKQA